MAIPSPQSTATDLHSLVQRKELERAAYDAIYGSLSEISNLTVREGLLFASEQKFIERLKVLAPGRRILEIGSGVGNHSILAAKAGAKSVIGIDISPEAVKVATLNAIQAGMADRCTFLEMDVEKLDLEDGSIDLILDHEVFSSLDIKEALPEFRRVLSKEGVILGIESFGHNPVFNLNRKINVLRGKRTRWAVSHIMSRSDIKMFRESFRDVDINYFHLFVFLGAPFAMLGFREFSKSIGRLMDQVDKVILPTPLLRNLAFKVVFEASSPLTLPRNP